jgi:methionine--tRNA ligase beta chain
LPDHGSGALSRYYSQRADAHAKSAMESLTSAIAALDGVIANIDEALSRAANKAAEAPSPATEKKGKNNKKEPKPAAPAVPDSAAQYHLCDLRVGKIVTVGHHPEADGLFHLTIDVGKGETRSVCAGLRKFLSDDEMKERKVILICNLKPRKLRGIDSEAMCLAGSIVGGDGDKETVEPLAPPSASAPGTLISVDGLEGERTVTDGKFVNGKTWDKVVARFSIKDGVACYDGRPMLASGAAIRCALADGAEIH